VPTDAELDGRLLIMVGVSQFSIDTDIGEWLIWGAVALIVTTSAFIIGTVILLANLGHIYAQRKGADKWRKKREAE
jgi:hypothetical protein